MWRPPPSPLDLEDRQRDTTTAAAAADDVGVYRPFRVAAEQRRTVAADEDDWSDDDDDGGDGSGINPDPGARSGIHGLGYRRRFDR